MAANSDAAPFEPEGLIFDCDGTLVDTMFFYWHSWEVICKKYGIEFDMKRFFSFAGVPVRDIYQTLVDEQFTDGRAKPDIDQILVEKHAIVKEDRDVNPPGPIKCVVDIVKKYHGKIPMAVASSGKRECVHADLERNGLKDYFDAIVTCEDVTNGLL